MVCSYQQDVALPFFGHRTNQLHDYVVSAFRGGNNLSDELGSVNADSNISLDFLLLQIWEELLVEDEVTFCEGLY